MFIGLIENDGSKVIHINSEKKTIIDKYKKSLLEKSYHHEHYYKDQESSYLVSIELFEIQEDIDECFVVFEQNKMFLHKIKNLPEEVRTKLNGYEERSTFIYNSFIKLKKEQEKYIHIVDEENVFEEELIEKNIKLEDKIIFNSIFLYNKKGCFAKEVETVSEIPFNNLFKKVESIGSQLVVAITNNDEISIKNNFIFIDKNKDQIIIPFKNIVLIDKKQNSNVLVSSNNNEKLEFLNVETFLIKLTLINGTIEFILFEPAYQKIMNTFMKTFSNSRYSL